MISIIITLVVSVMMILYIRGEYKERRKNLYKKFVNEYAFQYGSVQSTSDNMVKRVDISDRSYLIVKYDGNGISEDESVKVIDFYFDDEKFDTAIVSTQTDDLGILIGFHTGTYVEPFDYPYNRDIEGFMNNVFKEQFNKSIKNKDNVENIKRKQKERYLSEMYDV